MSVPKAVEDAAQSIVSNLPAEGGYGDLAFLLTVVDVVMALLDGCNQSPERVASDAKRRTFAVRLAVRQASREAVGLRGADEFAKAIYKTIDHSPESEIAACCRAARGAA